jgi:hypothetical protein
VFGSIETRKTLAHRDAEQAAVMAVAPAVVRTGDGRGTGTRLIEQPCAAVTAHIVKSPDRAVPIAQYENAFETEIEGLVIAAARDRIDVADDLPARQQHAFDLEPRQFRMVVDPGRQGVMLGGGGVAAAVEVFCGQAVHGRFLRPDYMAI